MKRIMLTLIALGVFGLLLCPALVCGAHPHQANIIQVHGAYYGGPHGAYHGGYYAGRHGPRVYYPHM
ncbi:MAG TPA: hypothetical protein VIH42_09650, partial [Thermoguttaceae bacterium]